MIYEIQEPSANLKPFIKSFWLIDGENDKAINKQKVIPDGYPELIFHYKDNFRINISDHWHIQATSLVAGQIKNHFYIENTGYVGMFGIKLQPYTLKSLFDFDMNLVTDQVISISEAKLDILSEIAAIVTK